MIIFAIIALIVAALLVAAVERVAMDPWLSRIIQASILVIAALIIMQRAGMA